MISITSALRKTVAYTCYFWEEKIKEIFGISCHPKESETGLDPIILRQIYLILNRMPVSLVKACGVEDFYISTKMGPSKPLFPNHGYFYPDDDTITLNADIFYHPDTPDDFFDHRGYFVSRPAQTLIHEMGHALDAHLGDISLKEDWLKLSGWSQNPEPGLKRIIIKDPGAPLVIGEWFYDPKAGFTRFYAKRNPYDDFADSFAFYVSGMKDKLPENKRAYFDALLKKYHK